VIPFQSYDHPDIYSTQEDYNNAFLQFRNQSERVIDSNSELAFKAEDFKLAGEARRKDATLAAQAILEMTYQDASDARMQIDLNYAAIIEVLNRFPGVGRRFEKLTDGIYSDYAHHPEEIAATIEVAQDEARLTNKKGVVVVYEPHQNVRQHEVKDGYKNAFKNADKIYWLPTYLTREDPNLKVLTNDELCKDIDGAEPVEMDDALWKKILQDKNDKYIVVLMTAGPADAWLRSKI
jgi:UDP-N-acetylmuramate--alanine ligase